MYESFYQLQRRPFSATPDGQCVCQSAAIQTVIDELVVCVERGEGIAVLTAPAGYGKTLLCEKVKLELGAGFVTILLRHGEFRTPGDLLRTLLIELGKRPDVDSEQELRLELQSALAELRRQKKLLVVLCDEAHNLSEVVLEELRRLVDHADHGVAWVRLLLAGQLELEEKLAGPELSALNQRLRSHATLSPLTVQESIDYIDYRLTWAGGRIEEIFHPDALSAIVDAADGNPRCLNQLCDHTLLLGYVAEQRPAPAELVQEALADLQHLPLTWNLRGVRTAASSRPAAATGKSSGSTVEFGNHLSTWETTSTFAAEDSSSALHESEVWEFGAETDEPPEFVSEDPFENLLHAVETELDRIEVERQACDPQSGRVQEEPVIDRYAAIDAGWPVEDLPATESAASATEEAAAPVSSGFRFDEPEARLHAEVLELSDATRDAVGSPHYDYSSSEPDEIDPAESLETPEPTVSPDRPFRNLFSRLRRKQKGLE